MKLENPQYVVVTKATRQSISVSHAHPSSPVVTVETNAYREGDLALLHPTIVAYHANGGLPHSSIPSGNVNRVETLISLGGFKREEGNLAALLYDGDLLEETSVHSGYFTVMLREGEFEVISPQNHDGAIQQVKQIYSQHDFEGHADLDERISEQYGHLSGFHAHSDKSIQKIPMEISVREISKEALGRRTEYERALWQMSRRAREGIIHTDWPRTFGAVQ